MALSRNKQLFHTEIFPKVKYDQMIGKYKINVSDYILLNLTRRQLKVLERICIKNNILLEKLPEVISIKETDILFTRLNYLKEQIIKYPNDKDTDKNKQEIFKIRTKLFEGHQELIYKILISNIPDLEKSSYKEDIIQSGYENLVRAIDNYNIEKSKSTTFRWYLNTYISSKILRSVAYIKKEQYANIDLSKIKASREKLQKELGIIPTITKLSTETGLEETRIKDLLVLEQLLNADSIEEIIENEETTNIDLIDYTEEEQIYQKLFKDLIMLIIDTLPNDYQKQAIILYYGLNDEYPKSDPQIAKILGLSRQRAEQHRIDAINNLRNPIRAKYIKELVQGYTKISLLKENSNISFIDQNDSSYEKLEVFLSQFLPPEDLIETIMQLEEKYQKILLSHFRLTNDRTLSYPDKIQELGISTSTYLKRKKDGLAKMRQILTKKYILDNQNKDTKYLLDYLMYNYLNKSKVKTRTK